MTVLYLLGALIGLAILFRSTTTLARNTARAATRRRTRGGDPR